MSTTLKNRAAAIAALTLLALTSSPSTASARPPDPFDFGSPGVSIHDEENCLLQRIGTQFNRCDNLTGNGVPAPAWIPELT